MKLNEIYGVIYLTTNLINNKIYIGQTTKKSYKLDRYFGSGTILKKAIKKYGKQNFNKIILDKCYSQDELNNKERYWIEYYKSQDLQIGYNISDGGEFRPNIEHSNINKELISVTSKKMWENKEFRLNHSESMRLAYLNPEFKERLSKANKKMWENSEHIEKMSKCRRLSNSKKEVREKISISNKIASKNKNTIEKMSDSAISSWDNNDRRNIHSNRMKNELNPRAKKIIVKDISNNSIHKFNTLKECSDFYNISTPTIIKYLKSKIIKNNMLFEYDDKYERLIVVTNIETFETISFKNLKECSDFYKVSKSNICTRIKNKSKYIGLFRFEYIEKGYINE